MGYDQNNDYYSNGDQSWRDQTNVYQTQREQPTPMGSRRPRRRSGWLKGILAVLLVVAISFGAFYLMRNVGVRLERTEDGVTLSMTNRSKQAEPEQAEQLARSYAIRYPRRKRLPIQDKVLAALEKRAKGR